MLDGGRSHQCLTGEQVSHWLRQKDFEYHRLFGVNQASVAFGLTNVVAVESARAASTDEPNLPQIAAMPSQWSCQQTTAVLSAEGCRLEENIVTTPTPLSAALVEGSPAGFSPPLALSSPLQP
jgi:hypothetical protein